MFHKGDTVEIQDQQGTRTFRRVLRVVQEGEHAAVGVDVFRRGLLVPFTDNQVTTYVKR